MSRFYVLPQVPINTMVIGGRGPYQTPPYNYSLSGKTRQSCQDCQATCPSSLKKKCKCFKPSRYMAYPRRAMMCDHNYKYYENQSCLLKDKVDRINYQTERDIRRGLRRPDIRKSTC